MNDSLISEKNSLKEPDLLSVGSRRSSLSMKNGIGDDLSENSDLEEAGNDMEPADGWDFAAQKLDPKSQPSFWKKLGSAAAYYGGKTVGKIGGILATLFNFLTFGKFTGIGSWTGLWKGVFSRKRDYQRARNRKAIPGWDGAQFEKRSKYQIDIDFRRVPDIWAYPIAEDPMDAEGKEKPPVISVHTNQVSRDLTLNEEQETGHSGIGIEFNRKNPRTGELERKTKDSNFRFVDYGRPYRAFGETDIAAACNDRLSNGLLVTELLIRVNRDLDSAVCLLFDGILQEQHLLMLQGVFCVDVTDDQFIGCFAAGCGTFITATAASFAASCERDHRHAQAQENDKYFLHHDNFLLLLNNDNRPWWPHL